MQDAQGQVRMHQANHKDACYNYYVTPPNIIFEVRGIMRLYALFTNAT